jgi:tetratricopeptide (TPR) repeat protein
VDAQLRIKLLDAAPRTWAADPVAYALYRQALAIDPKFASAWSALARAYADQAGDGLRPIDEGYGLARDAVMKALELDPDDAAAYAGLGLIALH